MEIILATIVAYFSGFWGLVELTGTIFALICVYLAAKHNQWTWFFGAIGVICFGFLFFEFKLYSDAALQLLFFLPLQVWGFMYWRKLAADANNFSITKSFNQGENTGIQTWLLVILGIAILSLVNGWFMATYTDADFAYADALTTWMSIFAQILMIRKYWESWVLWVVMDVIAIYIYFAKGLFVVSGLYFAFLIMASIGLFTWYRDWRSQNA